jgi:hypothetical protein
MIRPLACWIVGVVAAYGVLVFGDALRSSPPLHTIVDRESEESFYLPRVEFVDALSLGYRDIAAHIFWFRTINYFGSHYRSDRRYTWLGHMCDIVTSLSPKSPHTYRFCANMLAWEAGQVDKSEKILSKAIDHLPSEWIFPYLRGFQRLYFKQDATAASHDFIRAAKLPGAPWLVGRLAAKTMITSGSDHDARVFLRELLKSETDPIARRALEERLTELDKTTGHPKDATPS